ncbi:MAG TPA: M28 family peptidase, partial [Candidatus Binatia bacterium]|nr:M28 family peptidase [Candidatus Binatia bacterium]
SDHASFYNKGVPALHFYTGMHEDYHRPTDHWEKLNIGGMVKVSDTVYALATDLAASREPLAFVKPPSRRGG